MAMTQQDAVTFAVDEVKPATELLEEQTVKELHSGHFEPEIIAYHDVGPLVKQVTGHPLLEAVHLAFSQHRPLILSPDHLWITIARGVADHMALEGEQLRSRFVKHQGKAKLTVSTTAALRDVNWPAAFQTWCGQIADHVGQGLHDTLIPDFSTTSEIDRIAGHVVMMDIFEKYFEYELLCICGIPRVTLRGNADDWVRLRNKAARLEVFELGWWLEHLIPVLDQFVLAAQGKPDIAFWQRICKLRRAYGGDVINGWIVTFFPYLRKGSQGPAVLRNPYFGSALATANDQDAPVQQPNFASRVASAIRSALGRNERTDDADPQKFFVIEGLRALDMPSALSSVPITVKDAEGNSIEKVVALGGLIGVRQHRDTLAVEPQSGWLVCEFPKKHSRKMHFEPSDV